MPALMCQVWFRNLPFDISVRISKFNTQLMNHEEMKHHITAVNSQCCSLVLCGIWSISFLINKDPSQFQDHTDSLSIGIYTLMSVGLWFCPNA